MDDDNNALQLTLQHLYNVSSNDTSCVCTNLSNGTQYQVRIFVVDLSGNSIPIYHVQTATTYMTPVILPAPTFQVIGVEKAVINWEKHQLISGGVADGFIIVYRSGTNER